MSLKDKALTGFLWTFIDQFATKGISIVVQIILARLLLPEDFGLVAMVAVFLAVGNALVDSGMTQSLIRTKNPDEEDYSTVFFMNVIVSLFIYSCIYINSPIIADFYEEPRLINIIRVYSLSIIIKSFAGVQITHFTRLMDFKTQTLVQAPSLIVGGVVGVAMAYLDQGVWAIVGMKITQDLLSTIQYFIHSDWFPKLLFNKEKLKTHFDFGYKVTLASLLGAIFDESYNILIGKYFSSKILGFYNRAYTFQNIPSFLFSRSLSRVVFPTFSELQDDNKALKNALSKIMRQSMFLLTPIMVTLICIAEPLFRFVLTEKWLPAVPMFQILCVVGLFYPLRSYNIHVLRAKGFSGLILRITFFEKAITIIGIFIFIGMGVFPLLIFQAANTLLMLAINSYYSGKFINFSIKKQLVEITPVLALNLFLGSVFFYFISVQRHSFNDLLLIVVVPIMYFLLMISFAWILKLKEIDVAKELFMKFTKR